MRRMWSRALNLTKMVTRCLVLSWFPNTCQHIFSNPVRLCPFPNGYTIERSEALTTHHSIVLHLVFPEIQENRKPNQTQ